MNLLLQIHSTCRQIHSRGQNRMHRLTQHQFIQKNLAYFFTTYKQSSFNSFQNSYSSSNSPKIMGDTFLSNSMIRKKKIQVNNIRLQQQHNAHHRSCTNYSKFVHPHIHIRVEFKILNHPDRIIP